MKIELQKLSSVAGAAEGIPCISHPIRCGVQTFGERSTKCAGYITMPFMEHASILENVASRPVEYVDTQTEGVHISSFDHLNIHSWNLAIKTYARQGSRLQALHLFQQLQQNGIIPDKHSFVYTLVACGEPGALGDGKRLHAHLCASQFRSDFVILTALVNMYGKHSRLKDASNCFDQITRRDVVAWATVIQLFSQQGYDIEAHQFCSQMLQEGILPDKVALMCILDAYTHMSNKQCTHIHVSALLNIEEEDVQISTALLSMLGKTNKLLNAIQLFDSMLTRNVLTWSAMISLLERAEQNERARQIFNDMLEQGTLPNEITFLNILSAYKNEKDLIAGHRLHARLAGSTCEMGLPLSNSLLNFYIKCSSLQDAVLLFQNLSKRDVISFTAMISLSVDDGDADNAFGFLNRMLSLGHTPDQVAFTSLLDACNILSDLDARNILHDFIVECSYDSEHILTNSLLNVYCKHGSLMEAHWIFMKMSVRDIISWNGIIGMHSQLGNMHDALQLLSRMEQEIIPDKVTFLNIMICFTNFSALPHGKYIHTQLRAMNLVSELAVNTSLVSMYGRCGSLTLAQMIYSEVQEMDLVFWRELVTLLAGEYPRGHKELRGTFFYMHGPQDTVSWFTQRGVILKAEEDGRMFPATDTSSTIIDCLLAEAQKLGVQLQTKSPVLEVSTRSDSKFMVSIGGIKSQRSLVESDYLLLATGGTQQGFKLAKELGHSIVDPCPSLFSFKVADLQLQELAGISFPLVRAELLVEGQKHKNPSLTQVVVPFNSY